VTVILNPAGIDELMSDPYGPVAVILEEAADVVLAAAKGSAPVSKRGSKYAPPGKLKSEVRKSHLGHADDGTLAMWVGYGKSGIYPGAFVNNSQGFTRNKNQYGSFGVRKTGQFLERSINALDGWTFEALF
jgi:hypothetical protein